MHRNHVVPLIFGHVVEHPIAQNPGDRNHDVDTAERVERRFDDPLSAVPSRNRVAGSHRVAAGGDNVIDNSLCDGR